MLLCAAFAIVLSVVISGPTTTLAAPSNAPANTSNVSSAPLDTTTVTTDASIRTIDTSVTTTVIPNTSTATADTLAPTPAPVVCDKAYIWKPRVNACYKVYLEHKDWDTAVETCASEGAHLLVINTEEESKVVSDIMNLFDYSFWRLGVRDFDKNMNLVSINGEPFSQIYQGNTRRMAVFFENRCLYINTRSEVAAMPCFAEWNLICEKKIN